MSVICAQTKYFKCEEIKFQIDRCLSFKSKSCWLRYFKMIYIKVQIKMFGIKAKLHLEAKQKPLIHSLKRKKKENRPAIPSCMSPFKTRLP